MGDGDLPRYVSWYNDHRIRIFKDDQPETPWRVEFEPQYGGLLKRPVLRERTLEGARNTAKGLCQNKYYTGEPWVENIVWRKVAELADDE